MGASAETRRRRREPDLGGRIVESGDIGCEDAVCTERIRAANEGLGEAGVEAGYIM